MNEKTARRFTAFVENLRFAFRSLVAHKLRSALTLLGIVIGVATVIGMVALVEGFNRNVTESFESFGATLIVFQRFDPQFGPQSGRRSEEQRLRPVLTVADAEAMRKLCPSLRAVSPERYWFPSPRTGAQIPLATYRGREATPGEIGGVTEAYLEANNKSLERGRFFTEAEVRRGALVTVIGFKIAEALFPFEDPIGRTIQLKGRRFEVIGVLAEQGSSGFEAVDDHLLLPLPTFDRLFPAVQREFGTLIAAVPRSPALLERAIDEGRNVLRQRRGLRFRDPDNFAVVTPDRLIGNLRAVTDGIAATMILIASISLLVGGVGIMNIMLVSVKERTREIGLRKALGAKQGDILSQFLIEASTLGLVGGALGVAFGVGVAVAVRQLSTLATATPLWSILIGLAVSLGVGLTFGIFPAYRAAKLDPIEALRYE